jgi:antirestriction protein
MLRIFVNTWGNYNENGACGGRWISLPMDDDELEETLNNIAAAMGDNDPEFCIHDFEWEGEYDFREISELENIADLNEFCQKLDDLSEYEKKVYQAAVEIWGEKYVDVDELDDYNLMEDVTNDYDLGYYYAVESGCYDLKKMGPLANYIDYESFGRDIRFETDGGFSEFGWIERM